MTGVSEEGALIRLTNVRKRFPGRRSTAPVVALDDVTLEIPRGQIHGIVGRSGAGKSTLIRCLTGLEAPTSGTVEIYGRTISELRGSALRTARRSIGMVFQQVNLLDSRTAAGNIAHPLEIAGVAASERHERVRELLELVGLTDRADNHPAELSGGQRQRVGIARALATRPPVLLCDEPTSALDSDTTRQILELLRSLRDRLGITIVIITHEPSVVREVCDAVTLLDNGAIAESGSLLDVVTDPDSRLAHSLIPLPRHQPSSSARLLEVALGGDSSFAGAADVLHALRQAGIEAEIAAATLETISGRRVGRLQLDLPSLEQRDAARELLGAHGIDTEVAA